MAQPKNKAVKKLPFEIDIPQLLLHSRQVHLSGEIDTKKVQPIINQIMGLQLVNDQPIVLWINSPGGSLCDGFSLIDTIQSSKVPIFTIIRGWACSMAGLVSLSGHKRFMTQNSMFMAHDITAGGYDYGDKIIERAKNIELWQSQIFSFLREHSKLTEGDLTKARTKELWLTPTQCLQKGIVETVFTTERNIK